MEGPSTAILAAPSDVKVLLVDDKEQNLVALSAVLNQPGVTVVCAQSGKQALRYVLNETFAVILLDVNMPGMDGFETAELIRQREASADTPIIFLTAHADDAHMFKGYSLRAVDYILTPVQPEVLKAKVGVFVELSRKTNENRLQAERLREAEAQLRRQAFEEISDEADVFLECEHRRLARKVLGFQRRVADDVQIVNFDAVQRQGGENVGGREHVVPRFAG